MARKPRPRKDISKIRSLKDARRVINMYGDRFRFVVKAAGLRGGIRNARAVRNLLFRQHKSKGWIIRSMWKLERLVAVHDEISRAASSLDYLLLVLTSASATAAPVAPTSSTSGSAHAPPAPAPAPVASTSGTHRTAPRTLPVITGQCLESVPMRLSARVLHNGDRAPYHLTGNTLQRAMGLRNAGQVLRHKLLGGGTLEQKVRGLGELLFGLATYMLTEGPIPPELLENAAAAPTATERPPPSKADILDYLRQAKRCLLNVWDARLSDSHFDEMI